MTPTPPRRTAPIDPSECPLSCELDVPRHPAKLRGRHRQYRVLRRFEHHANTRRLSAIPPRSHLQVVLPHISTPEDPDSLRHEAYLPKERRSSIPHQHSAPHQTKRRLRVRPTNPNTIQPNVVACHPSPPSNVRRPQPRSSTDPSRPPPPLLSLRRLVHPGGRYM